MKIARWLLILTIGTALAANAHASFVIIDNFNNPNPAAFYILNPPSINVNPLTLTHPSGFGSTRNATFTVDQPSPLNPGVNALNGIVGFDPGLNDGVIDFNSNTFTLARMQLHYNNFTGNSGNFFDQGIPEFLYLRFLNIDPGIDVSTNSPATTMPVDVAISTTGGTLTGSFLVPQSVNPFDFQIDLNALSGSGDLSQVTDLFFTFNAGPNQRQRADFVLTAITLEVFQVPAPPAFLAGLLGLPMLARLRRR